MGEAGYWDWEAFEDVTSRSPRGLIDFVSMGGISNSKKTGEKAGIRGQGLIRESWPLGRDAAKVKYNYEALELFSARGGVRNQLRGGRWAPRTRWVTRGGRDES